MKFTSIVSCMITFLFIPCATIYTGLAHGKDVGRACSTSVTVPLAPLPPISLPNGDAHTSLSFPSHYDLAFISFLYFSMLQPAFHLKHGTRKNQRWDL